MDFTFNTQVSIPIQINANKEGELLACHIPEFDLYFGAKDEDEAIKRANGIVRAWIDFNQFGPNRTDSELRQLQVAEKALCQLDHDMDFIDQCTEAAG